MRLPIAFPPQSAVGPPTVDGLPPGFAYGVTRYADVILAASFPGLLGDLGAALAGFDATLAELSVGGGNRTGFVARFDDGLRSRGWGKRRIEIEKRVDRRPVSLVRGHEIDMFAPGSPSRPYPGVAVEMEWNNKDPFFDRDLLNFQALHRESVLAVGVIVTRGPRLQRLVKELIPGGKSKYGQSTTHWDKLTPRVDLGGGGECPLLLVGIEPESIRGLDPSLIDRLERAIEGRADWRAHHGSQADAGAELERVVAEARGALDLGRADGA